MLKVGDRNAGCVRGNDVVSGQMTRGSRETDFQNKDNGNTCNNNTNKMMFDKISNLLKDTMLSLAL